MAPTLLALAVALLLAAPLCSSRSLQQTEAAAAEGTRGDRVPRWADLALGRVLGAPCATDRAVTAYLGVPFAQAPLGARRFRAPLPYSARYPAAGLNATVAPPPCGSLCKGVVLDASTSSEDCLFLNVWVPPRAALGVEKVPVRVYIHGGDLTECSASDKEWDGCQVASKANMIQVNIQFRLGAFGMLAHPSTMAESNTTGNWGLLDQQLALKWVQDNIASFGGDPSQVLLSGHSRGAQMVDFHMVAPGSAGLFSSAVSQSAPCVLFRTLDQAYGDTRRFMEAVQCAPLASAEEELACMRGASWERVMNVTRTLERARPLDILWCDAATWQPTFHHAVDGTVVPLPLLDALEAGSFHQVPYLTGFTTAEAGVFVEAMYTDVVDRNTTKELIEHMYPGADPEVILDAYQIEFYEGAIEPEAARLQAVWTDAMFTCPAHRRLNARKRPSAAAYLYWWGATPSCPPEEMYLGPGHGIDLWFSFGVTTNFTTSETDSGTCDYNKDEDELSRILLTAFRSLAETGQARWPEGAGWAEWDPARELGTYLNAGTSATRRLDFAARCSVLLDAAQLPQGTATATATATAAT